MSRAHSSLPESASAIAIVLPTPKTTSAVQLLSSTGFQHR